MKTQILSIDGQSKSQIELPKAFESKIREDIVAKVLEATKRRHPYSPSPTAGRHHAAKGKMVHRRHVWRSGYGRGQSRVPRKIFSQKGSQFNWEAAEVPNARGGMRAHPPKIASMLKIRKINKKEMKIAFMSALSATVDGKRIMKKYPSIKIEDLKKIPFILESKFLTLKIKDLVKSLHIILGDQIFSNSVRKKSVRSGRGKRRGRKYKSSAGLLFVLGKNEKLKTNLFEVVEADDLNVTHLASGGLGRLTIYTENAIKNLTEKIERGDKK